MKRILLAGAALLALTAAQPTLAADAPIYKGPAPYAAAALFNWSGFYIGANAGWGWSRSPNCFGLACTPETIVNGNGFVGGGHIGFNMQSGTVVYGLEADILATGIKGDDSGVGGDINQLKIPVMGSIRGRLGLASNRTLFFLTGGAAYARLEANVLDVGEQERTTKDAWGWTVGAGIEHAFASNWTGRVEYRYVDFGSQTFNQTINEVEHFTDLKVHRLLAGLSFRW